MRCSRARRRLLLLALVVHLLVSAFFQARPGGSAARALHPDRAAYQARVALMEGAARGGDLSWLRADQPPHLKLYGVVAAPLGTRAAILLVNAALYLLVLVLVGHLAAELFGERAGTLAMGIAALWPSLLLHTTQLLRDPLYLVLLLAYLGTCLRIVCRAPSVLVGAHQGLLGLALLLLLWRIRAEAMPLLLLVAAASALLALLSEPGKPFAARGCGALLLLAGPLLWAALPDDACRYTVASAVAPPTGPSAALPPGSWRPPQCPPNSPLALAERVRWLRSKFLSKYPEARSNIDTGVELRAPGDVLRYLPRALRIAALAPFPLQWRALSPAPLRGLIAAEMLATYALEALVLLGLLRGAYRRPACWIMLLFAGANLAALGLVVANLGALYRLRYGFLLALVVLGVGALRGAGGGVGSRQRRGEHPGDH